MIDLNNYFKIANEINEKVARFLLSKFGLGTEIFSKRANHYGIKEDMESNEMYERYLKEKTPEVSLYTEEGERNLNDGLVWVVDPIEGTSNYWSGNPFWATQIALLHKKEPLLTIVNAPTLKQKFWAVSGSGAFLNDRKIHISRLEDLEMAVIDMGRGRKDSDKEWFDKTLTKLSKRTRTFRVFGACGLDISYCASGITDIHLNFGSEIYDLLPGALIVREAGGKVLNFQGNDWSVGDKGFLAANQALAQQVLKIIV